MHSLHRPHARHASHDYDVIIVGAGVAGATLAGKLKKSSVLILEKESGHKTDSGIVSTRYLKLVGRRSLIEEKIREMTFISPSGNTFTMTSERPFAYRLKRKAFSKHIRSKAKKKISHEEAVSVDFHSGGAVVRTNDDAYTCSVVVGCDGANSLVRRHAGIQAPKICYGLISENSMPELAGSFHVHLNKYFSPDFFAWMLSKEYGMMTAIRPREYFDFFSNKMGLQQKDVSGAAIPIGFTKSYGDNCMLLGDAAGQTKPLTGGGIIFSMLCAGHAANVIKMAFEQEYFKADLLSIYERRWRREIGWEIKKQLWLRGLYRKLTNRQIEKLFADFGQQLSKTKEFDYDRLSSIAYRLPKWKMLSTLISVMAGR